MLHGMSPTSPSRNSPDILQTSKSSIKPPETIPDASSPVPTSPASPGGTGGGLLAKSR